MFVDKIISTTQGTGLGRSVPCWGLENNCTRKLSVKNPLQVVIIKGFGSGMGSLICVHAHKHRHILDVYHSHDH